MACCMSIEAKEQKRKNLEINKQLKKERKVVHRETKILFLGMI